MPEELVSTTRLSIDEQQVVLDTLRSDEYCNQPPAEVRERLFDPPQYQRTIS